MNIKLYSIKDQLNGFAPPVALPNHETAIRWYTDMCADNITMKNNEVDFSIHYIGEMNVEKGEIYPADKKYRDHDLRELPINEREDSRNGN